MGWLNRTTERVWHVANAVRSTKFAGVLPRDPVIAEWLGGGATSASGQVVTQRTALQASAVFACVRNTAETIAALPCVLKSFEFDGNGRKRSTDATEHPLYSVLLTNPNSWQTAFDYWEMVIEHLQLRGNHYSRILRNGAGQTTGLDPLHPDRVTPFWTRDRVPAYRYNPPEGGQEILLRTEIFHVRGPIQGDGLRGSSPIALHRETIGLALGARDYGARLFANDARPRGVLEMDGVLDDEGQDRLRRNWQVAYGGENRHKVAILEDGLKYNPIGMTQEDAQYLETRGFTDVEIARLYRVPPHKIGILGNSTFNNLEQQNREWVTDALVPLGGRIEAAIGRDLLTPSARLTFEPRFDFAELLRGDIKTRTDANAKGIQWGYLSPNDARERDGLNPIGPEGDVYITPVNMQPMGDLLRPPASGDDDPPENPTNPTPENDDE